MQPVLASHAANLLGNPGQFRFDAQEAERPQAYSTSGHILDLWRFPICYGLLWDNGLGGALAPEQQGLSGKVLSEVGVPSG